MPRASAGVTAVADASAAHKPSLLKDIGTGTRQDVTKGMATTKVFLKRQLLRIR